MTNYLRKLVSGNKARFKDDELDLELDLVYVTDQVIIMGFPAEGLESLYRNRREDAKKFLEHRHKDNYWIFNFCPLSENLYDGATFNGRISRYPFPDHHAPPLSMLPLAAREMRLWLEDSADRVAVLHCKAGKGRSGTLACAYLLSLDISPQPPRLQRSYSTKQWTKLRAEKWMNAVETDDMPVDHTIPDPEANELSEPADVPIGSDPASRVVAPDHPQSADASTSSTPASPDRPTKPTLDKILELHSSRRMKQRSHSSSKSSQSPLKPRQGVTIPSQRRFLLYWSLILSHAQPPHFWLLNPPAPHSRPKIKLLQITVRLRDAGGAKMTIIKAVNSILGKTVSTKRSSHTYGQGTGDLWVSLARYDDSLVDELESWERRTRSDAGHFGKRKQDIAPDGQNLADIFTDGKWDKGKMVKGFAKLGRVEKKVEVQDGAEKSRIYTHVLTPFDRSTWNLVQKSIKSNHPTSTEVPSLMKDENDDIDISFDDTTEITLPEDGIILDAGREVRAKLYFGQVFMGWFWFIPMFHMPQPPPSRTENAGASVHWRLGRRDVDFPLGIGTWIVDIDVEMAWVPLDSDATVE
ncbi:hypothetical protein BU17DRAFT_78047 [Hysterangium stoloniferum]|nr:hypothetical protein BU17DRAFT_78047 [Hysterangium stoloniferum]